VNRRRLDSRGLPITTHLISLLRETELELVSDAEEQKKERNKAPLKS